MSENILHYGAVKYRANGSGNLITTLYSLDEVESVDLEILPLNARTDRQPNLLANFVTTKCKIRVSTQNIDETFNISKIVVYVLPIFTEYPN